MNGRIIFGILLVLLIVGVAVGIGAYAYNLGVAQSLTDSGKLVVPAPGTAPYPYPYYGWGFYRPFGFGFGLFGCLVPLLFLFLFFGLLRGMFGWRRHWGWGPRGYAGQWEKGVPPMFDEWHKRAHGESSAPGEAKPAER